MRHGRFATALSIFSMIALMSASSLLQIAPARAAERTASAPSSQVYFHYPVDGMRVPERFTVKIGLKEMGVAPAGVVKSFTGHHHLLIDTDRGRADAASGNAHLATAARRPLARGASASGHVEEDHDLCALTGHLPGARGHAAGPS